MALSKDSAFKQIYLVPQVAQKPGDMGLVEGETKGLFISLLLLDLLYYYTVLQGI